LAFSKLEMVMEVFRHGAREPLSRPFDPDVWTEFEGELTLAGMRQHYLLGAEMRKKYIEKLGFLSETFNHSEVYVRSTDVNRTIMSVQSHLLGLYPLGSGANFASDYPLDRAVPPYQTVYDIKDLGYNVLPGRYQPIPVHVVESNEDFLLVPDNICPNYIKMYNAQMETDIYKGINEKYEPFFEQVAQIFNISKHLTFSSLGSLVSDLYCGIFQNAPLPKDLTPEVYQNMTRLKDLEVQYVAVGSEDERKLLSTPFLKTLQQYFQSKINGSNPRKYAIFSAHDTTLQPYLAALNLTSWECLLNQINSGNVVSQGSCVAGYPVFASQIIFELHSNETQYFVKVIYNGVEMKLCESENLECSFDDFSQRISNYVLSDDDFANSCGKELQLDVERSFLKKK